MFRIYKCGICISGWLDVVYSDDPETAYRWMEDKFKRGWYCRAGRDEYQLRSKHHIIDMGKPLSEAVTACDGEESAHGLDGLNGCDGE